MARSEHAIFERASQQRPTGIREVLVAFVFSADALVYSLILSSNPALRRISMSRSHDMIWFIGNVGNFPHRLKGCNFANKQEFV